MDDIRILCKCCNTEVVKKGICGCPNMARINEDKITAVDMSQVVLLSTVQKKSNSLFSLEELADQSARRKRKIRRLEFEVR